MIFGYAGAGNQPYPFKRDQDNIAVWKRALTYSEITSLVSNQSPNVGVNMTTPQRNLDVKDVIRLDLRNTPPPVQVKGHIYFDGVINKLRVYDGTTWQNCW